MLQPPKWTEFPRYPVVAGTAVLAIGVTLAWWAKVDISPLLDTPMIRRGELWRLVTSILPHGGILHLLFNVYWLWVFGALVERVHGHFKAAALILLFAIGSNAMEFAFAQGGIGLSGVGYGLFGLLWILSSRDERFRDAVDKQTIQLFVGWFFFCIVATLANFMRIANIAHGAGAVLGILTGYAVAAPHRRVLFVPAVAATVSFGLWAATLGRPLVNFSPTGGLEEARWGYEALVANRNQEAVRWFRDATAYQPKNAEFWYDLGIAYQRLDNQSAALAAYSKAADHGDAGAQTLLGMLYENGRSGLPKDEAQAVSWYRKAADQGDIDAQNDLAWLYATSSDPAIRNPTAALGYAHKAVDAQKDHPDPNHLDTLAEAYYVNQQYADAVKTEQQAIALASAPMASSENKSEFQGRLEKYQRALSVGKRSASAK